MLGNKHTELRKSLLVALAGNNLFFLGLGLFSDLLDSGEPAVALGRCLASELVLVTRELEGELMRANLLNILCIGLPKPSVFVI
jgi:hypothetical protein